MTFKANPNQESVRCRETIEGPKVGYRVVAWRKRCGNMTRHETGLCHVHRDPGWFVGKTKEMSEEDAARRTERNR